MLTLPADLARLRRRVALSFCVPADRRKGAGASAAWLPQEVMRAVHSARIASICSPERAVMTLSPSLLKQPGIRRKFSSLGGGKPGVDGGTDPNVNDEPARQCDHGDGSCDRSAQVPGPGDHRSSRDSSTDARWAWHAQPPVPEVVHSAHGGHKGPVVHQGKCRTQDDRREDISAVYDPARKHGHHDEHLAERCHAAL
jgi:hypothetical protein